jgi:hypothetical protein
VNARDVNIMLTKAALLDARMKRNDPVEQADMATEWAFILHDVTLPAALDAVRAHYRRETRTITPADVVAYAEEHDDDTPNMTDIGQRQQRDAWLTAHGVLPTEFDELIARGEKPANILTAHGIDIQELHA